MNILKMSRIPNFTNLSAMLRVEELALLPSLFLISCIAGGDLESLDADPAEIVEINVHDDPVLQALSKSGDWEPLAHPLTIASEAIEDHMFEMTDAKRAELAEKATKDLTWYTHEGERYEALYVLHNGAAYGRKGPAPSRPPPNELQALGFAGAPAPEEQAFAGTQVGSGVPALPGQLDDIGNPAHSAGALIEVDYTADRRARQSTGLTQYPWRVTGAMSGSGNTQSGGCSGTKVGPRAVLTASHCVMDEEGSITLNGVFNPGQTSTTTPNGSFSWNGVFLRDWRVAGKADYAVFYLNDSSATYNLGWLGVAYYNSTAEYIGVEVSLSGYPCGANLSCGMAAVQRCKGSPRADKRCDGWMYSHTSTLYSSSVRSDGLLEYDNDCSFGQSGTAVYSSNVFGQTVLAVSTEAPNGVCRGPRVTPSMYNDVCGWIAHPQKQSVFGNHSQCA